MKSGYVPLSATASRLASKRRTTHNTCINSSAGMQPLRTQYAVMQVQWKPESDCARWNCRALFGNWLHVSIVSRRPWYMEPYRRATAIIVRVGNKVQMPSQCRVPIIRERQGRKCRGRAGRRLVSSHKAQRIFSCRGKGWDGLC